VIDDDFLKIVYKEHQNKLRWHSDVEYRLLNMFLIINPVIITAVIGIHQFIEDKNQYFYLTESIASILIVLTICITIKVYIEKRTYTEVAKDTIRIWEYFELFKVGSYLPAQAILSEKAKKYGEGVGWLATLLILWAVTIVTSFLLVMFGYMQLE